MPSTIVSLPKKKAQCTTISLEKSSFLEDSSGTSSCSQSELDEKSPSSQRKPSQPRRRRHHQKRNSTQPVVMENQPDSAVTYAGPDFMNDAPSPSSLPLPSSVMSSSTKQQRQQRQQQQPLTDVSKPYLMDPISEIQEKLRLMLKVQV
ncbi:unnamed protein product [Absidia cylindrospora]